jgi:hypothetical protein
MAEWRKIYRSLFSDARVRHLPVKARYVYVASIVYADQNGLIRWDAQQLCAWTGVSSLAMQGAMEQLESAGLVTIANGVAHHPHWNDYQRATSASAPTHARVAGVSGEKERKKDISLTRARRYSDTAAKTLTVPPVAVTHRDVPSHARHAAPANEQRLLSDEELTQGLATVRARLDAAERTRS